MTQGTKKPIRNIAGHRTKGTSAGDSTPTINTELAGNFTSAALTTAAGANDDLVLTSDQILANSTVIAMLGAYGGAGLPVVSKVAVALGTATITIENIHASAALNAAVAVRYLIV